MVDLLVSLPTAAVAYHRMAQMFIRATRRIGRRIPENASGQVPDRLS
jgi:hypothetical protein